MTADASWVPIRLPLALVRDSVPPLSLHAWLRWDAIGRLLPTDAQTMLEIGAGQGSVGALLSRRFAYVGLEPDELSLRTAVHRIGTAGTVLNEPAETYEPPEPFDVVCAFEVLEHIQDDGAALAQWRHHIRPGGWLLLSVPAGRNRFGPTDVKAGHYRRYDRDDLVALLAAGNLVEIELISYGFPLGYALEAARNLYARRTTENATLQDRTAASGRWLQPPERAGRLLQAVSAPFRYAQRPFGRTGLGTGIVARARRAT
jgi:SAM-dependent methyltransferase